MKKQVNHWWNSRKIKEKEQTFSTRKETLIFNLFDDLSIIETVKLYEEVEVQFREKLKKKLEIVNAEKECLDKFLKSSL
ncbi:MAG TPA: hypothetical protein VLA48_02710 [Nitrososphaeraceae archaeon]|nr:hypothetical protein [Nitrososphaeraceae archaeon]